MQNMGLYQIAVNTASLSDGATIGSYLVDAAGNLLTSTSIGGKQRLDVNNPSEFQEDAAHTSGDYGTFALAVRHDADTSMVSTDGDYAPLQVDATGKLKVAASVDFAGDYAEDSPATSGDVGLFTLLVRQDTLASSTSADGDYGAFKSNAKGELYVHDTDALAQLVLIKGDTASIVTSSGTTATNTTAIAASVASIDTKSTTIASNTGTTATNTGTISSTLTALSKAEDAAHASGDQGIQALAVRKDAQGSNVNADGDYASLITWSEGSLKVVDVANGAILQQQVAVSTTAAQVPASNLANRKTLMVQNTGSTKCWIGSATLTSSGAAAGIELPANSFMELECGPAVAVYAKTNAGSGQLNVLEMA